MTVDRTCIPLEAWPEADRAMWEALVRDAGPLDDPGPLRALRETSRRTYRQASGTWLAWMARAEPAALDLPPAERVNAERLVAWVTAHDALSATSHATTVAGVLRLARAAAHDCDWCAEARLESRLRLAAKRDHGARKKGRVLSSTVLFEAGLEMLGLAAEAASTPLLSARLKRDGLMIAVLAALPIRRRAFVALRIARELILRRGAADVVLDETMTKSGDPWEAPLPQALLGPMDCYVDEVRPWFLSRGGEAHDVLWVGDRGRPYHEVHMGQRITRLTEKTLGVRVPPHFFRDAAATTLARELPQDARLMRPLLGQRSFGVAERHYNHARGLEAASDYADILDDLGREET